MADTDFVKFLLLNGKKQTQVVVCDLTFVRQYFPKNLTPAPTQLFAVMLLLFSW